MTDIKKPRGWHRDQYTGPGGGLFTGPCNEPYHSVIPPWPIFLEELERRGLGRYADIIRRHMR